MADYTDKFKQTGASHEVYSDFLGSFIPHPQTKQITRKTNTNAVKQALRNLILTNRYERPRQPLLGGNIYNYLFEPFGPIVVDGIRDTIKTLIENYEPRVKLLSVDVSNDEDNNALEITISFNVATSTTAENLEITLYRVR